MTFYYHPWFPDYVLVPRSLIPIQPLGGVPQPISTGLTQTPPRPAPPSQLVINRHNYLKSLSQPELQSLVNKQASGEQIYLPVRDEEDFRPVTMAQLFNCNGKWSNILVGVPGAFFPIIIFINRIYQVPFSGATMLEAWQQDTSTGNLFFVPGYPESMIHFIVC